MIKIRTSLKSIFEEILEHSEGKVVLISGGISIDSLVEEGLFKRKIDYVLVEPNSEIPKGYKVNLGMVDLISTQY